MGSDTWLEFRPQPVFCSPWSWQDLGHCLQATFPRSFPAAPPTHWHPRAPNHFLIPRKRGPMPCHTGVSISVPLSPICNANPVPLLACHILPARQGPFQLPSPVEAHLGLLHSEKRFSSLKSPHPPLPDTLLGICFTALPLCLRGMVIAEARHYFTHLCSTHI